MARTPRIHPAYRSYSPLFLVMFPSLPTHSSLLPSVVTRSGTGVRKGVKHDECERHASPRKVERLTSRPKRQTCRSLPIPLVHPPERRSEGGRWTRRMGKERECWASFSSVSCHSSHVPDASRPNIHFPLASQSSPLTTSGVRNRPVAEPDEW